MLTLSRKRKGFALSKCGEISMAGRDGWEPRSSRKPGCLAALWTTVLATTSFMYAYKQLLFQIFPQPRMYTRKFARRALEIVQKSPHLCLGQEALPSMPAQDVRTLFASEQFWDMCEDALMVSFVAYLRGCKGLAIPPLWRDLIPKRL